MMVGHSESPPNPAPPPKILLSTSINPPPKKKTSKNPKTYNSGDSLVVTHLTTNPPVHCLYMAERTGSLIFSVLWSYVK